MKNERMKNLLTSALIRNSLNSLIPASVTRFFAKRQNGFSNVYPVSNVPVASRTLRHRNQRRNFRREKPSFTRRGMEINRAEGGFKNLNQGGKRLLRSINVFKPFDLSSVGLYLIDGSQTVDLVDYCVTSNEMNFWRQNSYKYKMLGINISVDYNTPVPVQTTLNKLICKITTPMLSGDFPSLNGTSMQLNMSRMGVKNFNFRLNRGNMFLEDLGPFPTSETNLPSVLLTLSSQLENSNPTEGLIRLGTVKISYLMAFWLLDRDGSNNKQGEVLGVPEQTLPKLVTFHHLSSNCERKKEELVFGAGEGSGPSKDILIRSIPEEKFETTVRHDDLIAECDKLLGIKRKREESLPFLIRPAKKQKLDPRDESSYSFEDEKEKGLSYDHTPNLHPVRVGFPHDPGSAGGAKNVINIQSVRTTETVKPGYGVDMICD
jgi:hypothetical protein